MGLPSIKSPSSLDLGESGNGVGLTGSYSVCTAGGVARDGVFVAPSVTDDSFVVEVTFEDSSLFLSATTT